MPDDLTPPPEPQTETAPPPPADDSAARIAAIEARAVEAERRAQAAEAARVESERQAQERLAMVANAISQMDERRQAPDTPEDENEFVTAGKMKAKLAELTRQVAEAAQNSVTEESSTSLKHLRVLNRNFAERDPSLKYYGKYKDEIESMIDKLPAKQAAHPDAYKGVYQFVLTKHLDEVFDAEFAERQAKFAATQVDEYGDPLPPTAPAPRAEPPMPRGDGGRQAISAPGRARPQKLDDWDRFAAARFYGGDTNKLVRAKESATEPPSIDELLGLKG